MEELGNMRRCSNQIHKLKMLTNKTQCGIQNTN